MSESLFSKSPRAAWWDYKREGAYFITIKTAEKRHYFGHVSEGIVNLSKVGKIADDLWTKIPHHAKNIELGEYIVMPNHIHGIMFKTNSDKSEEINELNDVLISKSRFQKTEKNTISTVIGSFKSAVTKRCNDEKLEFKWGLRFHDRIIRNEKEYVNVVNYIFDNPRRWQEKIV